MDNIKNNQEIFGLLYFGKFRIPFKQNHLTRCLFYREIFYVVEGGLVSAKLLAHAQNSLLRVINNDTYEEIPIVFNRLAPGMFIKNKVNQILKKKVYQEMLI